jgi:hypothetical protein
MDTDSVGSFQFLLDNNNRLDKYRGDKFLGDRNSQLDIDYIRKLILC